MRLHCHHPIGYDLTAHGRFLLFVFVFLISYFSFTANFFGLLAIGGCERGGGQNTDDHNHHNHPILAFLGPFLRHFGCCRMLV